VFEGTKKFHALDRAATVIGDALNTFSKISKELPLLLLQ
jgi:hypothetical protein